MNSSFCPIIKLEGKVLLNKSESQVYVLLPLLSFRIIFDTQLVNSTMPMQEGHSTNFSEALTTIEPHFLQVIHGNTLESWI